MNKIILGLALIFSTSMSFAQQKIGYINSEELILSMPEAKKADADISAYAKTFQDQLTTMQKELETKYKAYEAGAKTMSEAMADVKQKELQDLQGRIQTHFSRLRELQQDEADEIQIHLANLQALPIGKGKELLQQANLLKKFFHE